jgi:hypothetical protein
LIEALYSVKKRAANANPIAISGRRSSMSNAGPSMRRTLDGWWSVFHQSTENFMIGIFAKPTNRANARLWWAHR